MSFSLPRWSLILSLSCPLAWAPGCVGSGVGVPFADPDLIGGEPRSFAEIQAQIFDARCTPSCHGGASPSKGMSLEAGRSLDSLVGVPSQELPSLMRVAPGQSGESYLIVKVSVQDARRSGSRMPRTGPPYLSGPTIRALRRWIDAGADEDWEASEEDLFARPEDDDDSAGDDRPFRLEPR